jgi:hypothetical protein
MELLDGFLGAMSKAQGHAILPRSVGAAAHAQSAIAEAAPLGLMLAAA